MIFITRVEAGMDSKKALNIIYDMREFCERRRLGLFIVGSAAYTSAIDKPGQFCNCDDLDCVFVYNSLTQLDSCRYLRDVELLAAAENLIAAGRINMFSSKLTIDNIHVSADFISIPYLEGLANEPFTEDDTFTVKLADTIEKPENEYASFTGSRYVFRKSPIPNGAFILYRLPIHLWKNGEHYTGALYNKFIHHPRMLVEIPGLASLHGRLLSAYSRHFRRQKTLNPAASLMDAMLFRSRFSADALAFIRRLENFQEEENICPIS